MSNEEQKAKATFTWVTPTEKEGTNTIVNIINKRYTWEEFSALIREGRLDKLGRLPEQLAFYRSEIAKVKEKFASVEEYLLNKLFNYPTYEQDGKIYSKRPEKIEKIIVWRPNDYPYALEPGIEHYLIWSTHVLDNEEVEQIAKEKCSGYPYVYFVNPPVLRSIKSIYHAHVVFYDKSKVVVNQN